MTVKVLYFAILREKMKKIEEIYPIEMGMTVAALADKILGKSKIPLLFAVNHQYVARDHQLNEGDEVAFIPPMAGG
jgi:molybdopterin converting factor subunit 1